MTKHFYGTAASDLILDINTLPNHWGIETKLSQLTRWVLDAEAAKLGYLLNLGGETIGPSYGDAHRNACLRALALFALPDDGGEVGGPAANTSISGAPIGASGSGR